MLLGLVMVITVVTYPQDTVTHKDSVTPAIPAPVPAPPPTPTIEQIHYLVGLKTVTRGVAQVRDGVNRVVRTEKADSLTRRRAARRMGGLCGTARSFILSGRPRMQSSAYAEDRKSTRLNSSHTVISYAVFCLKKKNKENSASQSGVTADMMYSVLCGL